MKAFLHQLCVSTLGCPEKSLAEALSLAARWQLPYLELRALEGRLDLPAYFRERYGRPETWRKMLADHGVRIRCLGTSAKLFGGKAVQREELMAFARLAEELAAPYLRVFDGGAVDQEPTEVERQEARDLLHWWNQWAAEVKTPVQLAIETHDLFCRTTRIPALEESLGGRLTILWDTHHTWKKAGEAVGDTFARVQASCPHAHVKDSISQPSARHPFTYVQPGLGEFPLRETMHLLASQPETTVCLEWEKQWHPYLNSLDEAIADWLKL